MGTVTGNVHPSQRNHHDVSPASSRIERIYRVAVFGSFGMRARKERTGWGIQRALLVKDRKHASP
jgi:hypothetical protein